MHGSPLHIRAIDQAGDFFHDTYGGRMINLWGLVPVLRGWGSAMQGMTDAEKQEDGVSLHARLATAALGEKIWTSFASAAIDHAVKILGGADPVQFQRYADLLDHNPLYQAWIKTATERHDRSAAAQRAWLDKKR